MRAYMYPGQGSQVRGMAAELLARFPEKVEIANEILGFSVPEICERDQWQQLHKTQYTQPILFVVNALSHFRQMEVDGGRRPDFLLGHSLGEFNALMAAGCFSFEDGLRLVRRRGELFAEAGDGAMAAVIGKPHSIVREFLNEHGFDAVDVAAINTPSQIVVAGESSLIKTAVERFTASGIRAVQLNTSGAFHSRLMEPAAERFREELARITLKDLQIPVISNVTARPHTMINLADRLVSQIVSPVRWCESVQALLAAGVETFAEVGHGQTLGNMVQQIRNETRPPVLAELAGAFSVTVNTPTPAVVVTLPDEPAEEVASRWNKSNNVGTQVTLRGMPNRIMKTRTDARILFGRRAVVYVEDEAGYIDVRDLIPVHGG